MAVRGFTIHHQTVREYAELLLRARLGPKADVRHGKNWVDNYLRRNSAHIKTYYSSPLDDARGRAVNIFTHEAWFRLLNELFEEYKFDADCIFGCDETGFMPGRGVRNKVIAAVGKKRAYQREGGNRENITALVTNCADGTSLPPLIIFKSKAYNVNWLNDDPLRCS